MSKLDLVLGILFAVATVIFIMVFLTNDTSLVGLLKDIIMFYWYIRPLFIIPIVIFAFKKA